MSRRERAISARSICGAMLATTVRVISYLQVEHVDLLPVVTLSPKMVVSHRVDELRRHPDAVADLANAAFEHIRTLRSRATCATSSGLPL